HPLPQRDPAASAVEGASGLAAPPPARAVGRGLLPELEPLAPAEPPAAQSLRDPGSAQLGGAEGRRGGRQDGGGGNAQATVRRLRQLLLDLPAGRDGPHRNGSRRADRDAPGRRPALAAAGRPAVRVGAHAGDQREARRAVMSRRWVSLHVFYASNANPMLVDCIRPLLARLREEALISRYFFIKYWLEGPHVRLRLLPADGVDDHHVRDVAQAEIERYLRHRPSLYEIDPVGLADF